MNAHMMSGYSTNSESKADDITLKELMIEFPNEAKSGFGIGLVKVAFNWSFNRAAKACYRASSRGLLIRCEAPREDDFMFNPDMYNGDTK
ncbi:hypothetical protein OTK49_02505 [Vibrio coralliirubri]|uniref:hypothetical protein n=1 Tax=Vibrio coralliirubri TaxID=1516159 RepID=UPI002283DEE5|nr:hypothetical protein [Vibrio coralliirubri]MCY9861388.1 hypothetical protein [Vibrio coralliirubri]